MQHVACYLNADTLNQHLRTSHPDWCDSIATMAGLDPQVGELVPAECPDVARVHITTNPASNCGRVELHSVLAPGVVQRSALLQGISESSGESSLPVDQSDIFGWLHVVTRRPDDVASLYSHGVLPDMSKPASVLSVREQANRHTGVETPAHAVM